MREEYAFFLVLWAEVRLSPLNTSATNWPTVPAPDDRWWMNVEQSVYWDLAEETEILGENLPQCHSVYHKSHMGFGLAWARTRAAAEEYAYSTVWQRWMLNSGASHVKQSIAIDHKHSHVWVFLSLMRVLKFTNTGAASHLDSNY
jgi:hypothetical protein